MIRLLRIFPIFCLVCGALSVIADFRGVIAWVAFGQPEDGFDVSRPLGFQAAMILLRAIVQSLQWVAYAALGELAIRLLDCFNRAGAIGIPAGKKQ